MAGDKEDNNSYVPEGAPDSVTEKLPREKLPRSLQKIVDKQDDEDWLDQLYDGKYGAASLHSSTQSNDS